MKAWIKLWARWYESDSHLDLSPAALQTGPHLLVLARENVQEDGSAILLTPAGKPHTAATLARRTRWGTRKMKEVLQELEEVGTLERREGVWAIPNFTQYQETPAAARKRRQRDRERDRGSPPGVTSSRDSHTPKQKQKQKQKQRPPGPLSESELQVHVANRAVCESLAFCRRPKGKHAIIPRVSEMNELLEHLLREPGSTPQSVRDLVVETIEKWAELADESEVEPRWWGGNLLTPKGWEIMLRDIERAGSERRDTSPGLEVM